MPHGPRVSKTVPPSVKKAIKDGLKDPQLSEVAAWFFHAAGGPRAVATLLFNEFKEARAGSQIRQRILETILRVTKFANEKRAPQTELGGLTDEDLERELADVVGELPDADSASTTPAAAELPAEPAGPTGASEEEGRAGGAEAG